MSGGKGGGETTTAQIPEWAREPTIRNLQRAEDVQQIGYQPYMGPDLAAFNQAQMGAMQDAYDTSRAFGMSAPMSASQGMPEPIDFGGGIQGYSAYPLFEQAQRELAAQNPLQQRAYDDLFVEPTTNNFDPIMTEAETNFPRVTSPILQGGGAGVGDFNVVPDYIGGGVMDTAPAPTSPVTGLPEQTAGQAYNEKITNRQVDAVIRANPDYLKPKVKSHRGRVSEGAEERSKAAQREAIKEIVTKDIGEPPKRSDFDNYNSGSKTGTSNKLKDRAYRKALDHHNQKVKIKEEFGLAPSDIGIVDNNSAPAPNKTAPAPKKAPSKSKPKLKPKKKTEARAKPKGPTMEEIMKMDRAEQEKALRARVGLSVSSAKPKAVTVDKAVEAIVKPTPKPKPKPKAKPKPKTVKNTKQSLPKQTAGTASSDAAKRAAAREREAQRQRAFYASKARRR